MFWPWEGISFLSLKEFAKFTNGRKWPKNNDFCWHVVKCYCSNICCSKQFLQVLLGVMYCIRRERKRKEWRKKVNENVLRKIFIDSTLCHRRSACYAKRNTRIFKNLGYGTFSVFSTFFMQFVVHFALKCW
jgi:hypothetical protein